MKTVGIICEYNPFHNGHQRQIQLIRERFGPDTSVVCLMSGNYVQRGAPALLDKSIRAQAAVLSGADLVLELPVTVSLSSAEGFASGGVAILRRCCDVLCFGTESMTEEMLLQTASALLSPPFSDYLKTEMNSGCSFPKARQQALERMGIHAALSNPNDILGVEYAKAILSQNASMDIFPVYRNGDYHSDVLNPQAPSATALRRALLSGEAWQNAVPEGTIPLLQNAAFHTLAAGEKAILSKLRTMTDADFERLPYGSEGLWRKLMKACRVKSDLSAIIEATKSKRYTRTRIDRMILCAFLGLTEEDMGIIPSRIRALAFDDRGRGILRSSGCFCNAGEAVDEEDQRIGSLYGLFAVAGIEPPDLETKRRIFYYQEKS